MQQPVVVIGVGEMGGVFARGLLKLGHPVFPVRRCDSLSAGAELEPDPVLVLVAVGEADLPTVLETMPVPWRNRLGLLQNELLPRDWYGIPNPTLISVWFEKKRGQDHKVILPSPVFGPRSALLADALATLDIPTRTLRDADALLFELVAKNLYILTTNIAGLRTGSTVSELWDRKRELAEQVGNEIIDIQEALTGSRLDRGALFRAMADAIAGDPEHQCMGRSAPTRLKRAIAHGDAYGLALPMLRAIAAGLS